MEESEEPSGRDEGKDREGHDHRGGEDEAAEAHVIRGTRAIVGKRRDGAPRVSGLLAHDSSWRRWAALRKRGPEGRSGRAMSPRRNTTTQMAVRESGRTTSIQWTWKLRGWKAG